MGTVAASVEPRGFAFGEKVATPDFVFDLYRRRGFLLTRLATSQSGCNEFVFRRDEPR